MAKTKFSLRIKDSRPSTPPVLSPNAPAWMKRKSLAYSTVTQDKIKHRNDQLDAALKWCQQEEKRGWAALKTGLFPLIGDARTINDLLDGKVKNEYEREYCSILTSKEEECLVRHVKNKNRCYQGMNRKEITEAVVDILNLRKHALRQFRGRKITPLSRNSENVLKTNKLSKSFWKRWDTKHKTLSQKRPGNVSMKRALSCTLGMAVTHLDELAAELISLGIFTDPKQLGPGEMAW